MEDGTWNYALYTSSSRGYRSPLKSISDLCYDQEEIGEEDVLWVEYPCPFCEEEFDLFDLCGHICENHDLDDESGECPICATRIGIDMVGHITMNHSHSFDLTELVLVLVMIRVETVPCSLTRVYRLEKLKQQKNKFHSTFLKKEFEDECLWPPYSASSSAFPSFKMAPDPLLSFLFDGPQADQSETVRSDCYSEETSREINSDETILERDTQPIPLSDEEHKEKAKRSEFARGLLLSIMLDDIL